ncbi:MAG: hypothetical protein LUE27_06375, partial [Clostridia bacterium]|nr:hypothetical protein [Clostridia bacterium]
YKFLGSTLSEQGNLFQTYTSLYDEDDNLTCGGQTYVDIVSSTALELDTASLADGKAGEKYTQQIYVSGGTGDYTVSAESLPKGMYLKNRALAGTPEESGIMM